MTRARVLVADDDATILRLVATILRREGCDVDTACGGRDALEKIDGTRYAAVLLDLMMPGVSGFEVLARLRPQAARKFVIIMSAASPDMIDMAGGLNVFAVLRKPFEIDDIVTTVRACVTQPEPCPDQPPELITGSKAA